MEQNISKKSAALTPERFHRAILLEYLRNIDLRWQEHLENLESLREAVSLRGYAQRNPLQEYKLEGFTIFDRMIEKIRLSVGRKMFAINTEDFQITQAGILISNAMLKHGAARLLGQDSGAARMTRPAPAMRNALGRSISPVATPDLSKVGRNDKCPCGSGKKYKYCHGR